MLAPTYMMKIVDLVIICEETLRNTIRYSLVKEFIEWIHMNP